MMKQPCTLPDCPNDARATVVIGSRVERPCALHLGLLAVEHGRAMSTMPLGDPAADRWEPGRE